MPALTLAWWDVEQAVERATSIESRVVQVAAGDVLLDDNSSVNGAAGLQAGTFTRGLPLFAYRHWPWLIVLSVVLLLAAVFVGATRLRAHIASKLALAGNRRRYRQRLRRACRINDASATRRALIEWSRLHWNDAHISGLHHIEPRVGSPDLVSEMARLDAAIFAEQAYAWRGERLWELLEKDRSVRYRQTQGERDLLPGPYPQRV